MAGNVAPNIVTDGLVLYLDAANAKSYVSGSTAWNDISQNGVNGTLVNGPTFNSGNGGSIVFDGVNDYGKTNIPLNLSNTDKITIDIWMRFTTTELDIILEHSINFNNNNAFLVDINEWGGAGSFLIGDRGPQGYNISYTSGGFNDGKWHNFITTIDRSLPATQQNQIYADNVLNTILHQSFRADISSNFSSYDLYLGSRAGSLYFYTGNISSLKIYNRVLSQNEITQNYNATKGRFGL